MPGLMLLTHLIIFPGLLSHHSEGELLQEGKKGGIGNWTGNQKWKRSKRRSYLKSFLQIYHTRYKKKKNREKKKKKSTKAEFQ